MRIYPKGSLKPRTFTSPGQSVPRAPVYDSYGDADLDRAGNPPWWRAVRIVFWSGITYGCLYLWLWLWRIL